MIKKSRGESGFSMVEVLASILLLSIAIIPMFTMLDSGMRSATTSGKYEQARALANTKLEEAKSLPYATVKSDFPAGTGSPNITSSNQTSAAFPGLTYTVKKQFLKRPTSIGASQTFGDSPTDQGLIRLTVKVSWGSGNSYSASGLVVE